MSADQTGRAERQCRDQAFTLIEVMVSVGVMGVLLVTLYAGISFGFYQIEVSREDERATQILAEKMEIVRLLSWDQVVNLPGYVPSTFTASYEVTNPTNAPTNAFIYTGTVVVTNAPLSSEAYSNDLRMITITLNWASHGINHRRKMRTFVSRYGLQNYVY
ncbi:MAG TPA: prepilin-type N-terminal cleavage/methylation domain-containing protein [Patescibacteria group bacterium]|nr:prepilin-type N-terminal cleavage/methylation domain-containing protein [Patescibacteria group bacterium]